MSPKLLASIIVSDILLFPYIPKIPATISVIIIVLLYLKKIEKVWSKGENSSTVIITILILLSQLNSYIRNGSLGLSNVSFFSSGVILVLSLLYNDYYINNKNIIKEIVGKIFYYYLIIVSLIAFMYLIKPGLYFYIRNFFTMNKSGPQFYDFEDSRFTFIFSDPNNCAILLVAVSQYECFIEKRNATIILLLCGICVSATFSLTGVILYLLFIVEVIFSQNVKSFFWEKKIKIHVIIILILFVILIFILAAIYLKSLVEIYENVFSVFEKRSGYYENNVSGGRWERWINTISIFPIYKYFLIGTSPMVNKGILFRPHNGHLYLLYSYGMIVYIYLLSRFFNNFIKENIGLYLTLFIGFTMNVIIIEFRGAMLFFLLISITSRGKYKRRIHIDKEGGHVYLLHEK